MKKIDSIRSNQTVRQNKTELKKIKKEKSRRRAGNGFRAFVITLKIFTLLLLVALVGAFIWFYSLFDFSKKEIKNRCKLILGTGTNDTAGAVRHTLYASRLGCDGVLVVTPYYNKGTKEGIIRHYLKIAESSDVPVLLYNVPSRTGVTLDIELLRELSKCERIVGIKEATDSEDRHLLLSAFGEELWLYSGNDSQIYSTLALGGLGVVSVVSNLYPRETKEICDSFFKGDIKKSLELQLRLMPVINALFLDTNPAPIKFAMSQKGLCHPDMRLPMWLPTPVCQERIRSAIAEFEKENK